MKRNYLVIIAVSCVFFLLAGCQQQAKVAKESAATEAVAKEGQPKIEFESLVYDFGKVGPGQKLLGEFKFTNTGDGPLKISKVEKCCGAVTKLDKDELAPGESGVLNVQYTSSRMANKIMKRLYVNSNDKATPRATLTIKAETVLNVTFEPRSLKLILNEENAGCPKITLTSNDNQPFSVTSFNATGDCLTAEIDPTVKATKIVLEPKADPDKLRRGRSGRINIGLAYSKPDMPPETLTILFQALSQFSIRPSMLVIMYNNPNEPVTKSLLITNNYDEDFEIESTSSKEGYIKVVSQNKIDHNYQFELEITPPPGDDVKRFSDTFTINLKNGDTLGVVCRGIYRVPNTQ